MLYGPFHRLRNPATQSFRTAIEQKKTFGIWGRTPRGGFEPTVQAYFGALPDTKEGIEFFTRVRPNGQLQFEARWYPSLNTDITEVDQFTVRIDAEIRKIRYSCR